jgi:hypothetical protein
MLSVVGTTQLLQVLVIAGMALRLARQYRARVICARFVLHGYISTALVFAGLYFALELSDKDSAFNIKRFGPDSNLGKSPEWEGTGALTHPCDSSGIMASGLSQLRGANFNRIRRLLSCFR